MKLLMTPAEVAAACFGGDANIAAEYITDTAIAAAQRRYLRPVLGESLCAAVGDGRYGDLCSDYLKPALALYVKKMVLPLLSAQPGILGVVSYSGQGFGAASDKEVAALARAAKTEADIVMRMCVEYLETSSTDYPEYDPRETADRIKLKGGIAL